MQVNLIDKIDLLVIDDFLEFGYYQLLKKQIAEASIWGLRQEISLNGEGDSKIYYGFSSYIVNEKHPDFEHYYNNDLDYTRVIKIINEKVKKSFGFKQVYRCRLDMTTYRGEDQIIFAPHIDLNGEHYTSIYHLTTCNAPTIIYNEQILSGDVPKDINLTIKEKIDAKANRLILFNGNYIHTGMCPTDVASRILINTNYK